MVVNCCKTKDEKKSGYSCTLRLDKIKAYEIFFRTDTAYVLSPFAYQT